MAYIGVQPAEAYTSFAVQHFTTSATTSYTLDNPVANENEIALFINNVRQEPGSSYAYTASGTTLTLSAATSASDTMYCVFIGKAVQTVTPANNSVTGDMLSKPLNYDSGTFYLDDTNNRVGIGTSSPSELLEVNGNIRVGVGSQTAPSLQIGDNDTGIFDAGANAIGFTTAGTEKVRIVSGGSVAIGATSAAQKLHVEGSIYTSGSLYVGGTGSANALDDYEEGTWTPVFLGGTGNPTVSYNTQEGRYTKIGNLVYVQAYALVNTTSGGSGNLRLGGLPFTAVNASSRGFASIALTNIESTIVVTQLIDPNSTYSILRKGNQPPAEIQVSDLANGEYLWYSGVYQVS